MLRMTESTLTRLPSVGDQTPQQRRAGEPALLYFKLDSGSAYLGARIVLWRGLPALDGDRERRLDGVGARVGVPVTTVSAMMGHANPSFTLACYGRDPRDEQTMVADVLARAATAQVGS